MSNTRLSHIQISELDDGSVCERTGYASTVTLDLHPSTQMCMPLTPVLGAQEAKGTERELLELTG